MYAERQDTLATYGQLAKLKLSMISALSSLHDQFKLLILFIINTWSAFSWAFIVDADAADFVLVALQGCQMKSARYSFKNI